MARTGFFHHIGSFLLLAATVLLIVTCISAPVVNHLSVLKVRINDANEQDRGTIDFGTFGYCVDNVDSSINGCTRSHVGYNAAALVQQVPGSNIDLSDASAKTANALTKVMILHPIACGLSFIAFLLALGAGILGSFLASMVALLAFLVTLVVLITDFVGLALLRNAINKSDQATARYGAAAWTLLASAVCNLLATLILFFTCCSARLHKKRNRNATATKAERYDSPPHTTSTRRRWF
ncbi:pH-response regulator protein palI/RIM9 [Apiospora phragmitis]|uniref:PH-response regulator protein palI/RIM9 n=1 Tax=Apiospora phragmitis TaxID=2905665 RepID=A0ABR1TRJ8_9PEZI